MTTKWNMIFCVLILSACGTQRDASTSATLATGENWQTILDCQAGAVVVDVDTQERRRLQVVIRDPNLFPYFDAKLTYGQIRNEGERIYQGQTYAGVFEPHQFVNVYAYDVAGSSTSRPGFEARRSGNNLIFRALDFVKTNCGGSLTDNNFASCEVANYIFRDCR